MRHGDVVRRSTLAAAMVALVIGPLGRVALAADDNPPLLENAAQSSPFPPSPGRDFLLGQPRLSFGVRANWLMPTESGDLYGFVRDNLTIDKGDFHTAAFTAELGTVVTRRVSVIADLEINRRTINSEYRHFIGSDGLPINQETSLKGGGYSMGLKIALMDPGRRISRFAWIPRTVTPFIGGGGGLVYYHFKQQGEFVDFQDLSIFKNTFESKGWGPSLHAFGGADIHLWRNVFATVEGRYQWAHSGLSHDFVGFDGIDLSGFRTAGGVNVEF